MIHREHVPLIDGYDDENWQLHCTCGRYLGLFQTIAEAQDAHEDHVAGEYAV